MTDRPKARVVIAAGGTAGHVVPALAVADALRDSGAQVSFIGTPDRAEARLVPEAGYEIDHLRVRGLDRSNPLKAAGAIALAGRAIPAASSILERRQADVVLGGGGYVAAPAGFAALTSRRPLVLTEADRHLGLTNRLLARRARRVCLAFAIPGFEGERFRVTGRPVPRQVTEADPDRAREEFGIPAGRRCLVVFGGSQGALTVNRAVLDGLLAEDPGFHVIHVCGTRDFPMASERVADAGDPGHYRLREYLPGMGEALAASDLALARSGASVFELAAAGCPAILVPYPYATGRHQHHNAEWMAAAGAALVIEDADLSPGRVRELAGAILSDDSRLDEMSRASLALAMPDAAADVANEVLAAAGGE